jgi:sulfite reductase (NADPH) flavoprotein alpha-component
VFYLKFQVINSPLNQEQSELLNGILPTMTESQKIWLSGYLFASQNSIIQATSEQKENKGESTLKDMSILYGSQTGNAHRLALKAGKTLEANGYRVTVSSMNDFKPNSLKKVQNLLIIVSTHGEGDPPDNALSFHKYLHGNRAPKLKDLYFSVLSLGDSSYEFFCQSGKEFDQRLEELGGTRLHSRVDCDLDYEDPAVEWIEGVIRNISEAQGEGAAHIQAAKAPQATESVYSRSNPYRAEVLENLNLNGRGSNKETRHLELSLVGSGLTYEPGDSLGVCPQNDPTLVDLLLEETNWSSEEKVTVVNKQGDVRPLKEALRSYFEITVLTKPLLQKAAQLSVNNDLQDLVSAGNEENLKEYIKGRDLLDLIRDFGPWIGSAQDMISILRKIPPRLYSISSSLLANPDEVHLTIGAVRYDSHGRERKGVSSILCAERLQPGDKLPIFIQHNPNFKLPQNSDTPIIMIGPGTGIAPFRAFMQEREESGASGKTWLFFGDQHFVTDFLYQTEWKKMLEKGILTKLDVAFSRDMKEKVYVQHRMHQNSKELFEWLQKGAHVYVCGDEKNMAHDVHNALVDILLKEGGLSREKSQEYLANMQQQKRYQRDVY